MSAIKTISVNPDYETAQFEDCVIDLEGKIIMTFARYSTLEDAQNKENPIPHYIVEMKEP